MFHIFWMCMRVCVREQTRCLVYKLRAHAHTHHFPRLQQLWYWTEISIVHHCVIPSNKADTLQQILDFTLRHIRITLIVIIPYLSPFFKEMILKLLRMCVCVLVVSDEQNSIVFVSLLRWVCAQRAWIGGGVLWSVYYEHILIMVFALKRKSLAIQIHIWLVCFLCYMDEKKKKTENESKNQI